MVEVLEIKRSAKSVMQQLADMIASAKKVVVVTGAGISTNCGIPYGLFDANRRREAYQTKDYRSQNGLYTELVPPSSDLPLKSSARHQSMRARDMFDCNLWRSERGRSGFFRFTTSMHSAISNVKDTSPTHKFIKLLNDQGRLVRNYTQNIDGLETRAGLCSNLSKGPGLRSRLSKTTSASTSSQTGQPSASSDRCEVVCLHGELQSLRCTVCNESFDWDALDTVPMTKGEPVPCSECTTRNEVRAVVGLRRTTVGFLRPNVVLYGEEHPEANQIELFTKEDLRASVDVLLILGTSLKVYGIQKLVQDFAKVAHSRKRGGSKVIMVNHTSPGNKTWSGVIDYWVNMDCDAFVAALRGMRPDLWQQQRPLQFPVVKGFKIQGRGNTSTDEIRAKSKESHQTELESQPSKRLSPAKLQTAIDEQASCTPQSQSEAYLSEPEALGAECGRRPKRKVKAEGFHPSRCGKRTKQG